MKKCLFIAVLTCLSTFYGFSQVDYEKIRDDIDNLQSFEGMDLSLVWTMVSQKPGEDKSVQKIQVFRRDSKDQHLYIILKPEVDKGQGYLMSDDNGWMYDPTSRKFSHFSLKENIGDSDAKNDDVDGFEYVDDYNISEAKEGKLGSIDTHIITLEAKTNEVTTPKLIIWVRKGKNIVLKQEEYSLSGRLVRTMLFPKWTTVGGRYIPSHYLILDNLKEGEKTQMTISNISNAKIPDDVFTKPYLERINNK